MEFEALANIKPSVWNWLISGAMTVTFLAFFKYIFTKWYVPGVSEVFGAV